MAIYLLNLGFSMSPTSTAYLDGNFEPNSGSVTTGFAQSCAWYQYTGNGQAPALEDKPYFFNSPLNPSDWTCLGDDDKNPLNAIAGDFILVRIFAVDAPAPLDCKIRVSAVFGRGHDHSHDHINDRQSPLQMVNGKWKTARAVIDSDDTTYLSWYPSNNDTATWTYCLGMLHNAKGGARIYSMSVGASIYKPTDDPENPTVGVYGHDPTMKVGGSGPLDNVVAA